MALVGLVLAQTVPAPDSLSAAPQEPLIGVTVKLDDGLAPRMCIPNGRGRYLLEVPRTGTLAVTFAGYVTQEKDFRQVSELDVVLQPEPGLHRTRSRND